MKKLLQQVKWDAVLVSVLYVVLGIVCIVIPETMVKTLGYLIGALLIVAGAVSMICYLLREAHENYYRNDFVYGLVSISIGIIVLYKVDWLIELVPIILGILVVTSGCRKLQDVIDMKRMEYGSWAAMLVLAAINVIFGVVVILNPFETLVLLFQLVGAGLIFSGVTDCFIVLYFAGKIRKYYDDLRAVEGSYVEIVNGEEGQPMEEKHSMEEKPSTEQKPSKEEKKFKESGKKSKEEKKSLEENFTEEGHFGEEKKSKEKEPPVQEAQPEIEAFDKQSLEKNQENIDVDNMEAVKNEEAKQ